MVKIGEGLDENRDSDQRYYKQPNDQSNKIEKLEKRIDTLNATVAAFGDKVVQLNTVFEVEMVIPIEYKSDLKYALETALMAYKKKNNPRSRLYKESWNKILDIIDEK